MMDRDKREKYAGHGHMKIREDTYRGLYIVLITIWKYLDFRTGPNHGQRGDFQCNSYEETSLRR